MTIYDFISAHPDDHVRVIRYIPAPDVIDEHGCPVCGGEGTSTVMFDSTTGEGDLAGLLMEDIINSDCNELCDGVYELEYMPEDFLY